MFLPIYRAWVIVASLIVCLTTWYVIERTKLGSYLRAATENPALVQAFGINVPRMITLTFGFGVGLAALAGVMAAPIYQVNPLMGADLIIVVFAVVVIGGMGSIMGSILTGFGLGVVEGLTKYFYPEASNTVIFVVMVIVLMFRPRDCSEGSGNPLATTISRSEPARTGGNLMLIATAVMAVILALAPVRRHLPGVRDEGAVLRALRVRVQPAAGFRRPAVVRARDVPRHRGLRVRLRSQSPGD